MDVGQASLLKFNEPVVSGLPRLSVPTDRCGDMEMWGMSRFWNSTMSSVLSFFHLPAEGQPYFDKIVATDVGQASLLELHF